MRILRQIAAARICSRPHCSRPVPKASESPPIVRRLECFDCAVEPPPSDQIVNSISNQYTRQERTMKISRLEVLLSGAAVAVSASGAKPVGVQTVAGKAKAVL